METLILMTCSVIVTRFTTNAIAVAQYRALWCRRASTNLHRGLYWNLHTWSDMWL